ESHVESPEELPKKTKLFFALAAERWEAEYYAKVNDDVYVNIDALGSTLAAHIDNPRVYIGCMKSGEVFSEEGQKWYEPDWWKFGDGKTYFRHASGEMFVISKALARFVSINRAILRTYAFDDVSTGSWFIGLNVKHIDDKKFCCASWSTGGILCRLNVTYRCGIKHKTEVVIIMDGTKARQSKPSEYNILAPKVKHKDVINAFEFFF
ncbi:hydroxyproline O-galactosyltransferase HPGT1, partial [Tanacetum coccineum]